MILSILSNPHLFYDKTDKDEVIGGVVVSIGSFTNRGSYKELSKFSEWVSGLKAETKIIMPGPNDSVCSCDYTMALANFKRFNIFLAIDKIYTISDKTLFFSPWTVNGQGSFSVSSGAETRGAWRNIPEKCDVLFSNHPPYGIMDDSGRAHFGCFDLLNKTRKISGLKYHIFNNSESKYRSSSPPVVRNGVSYVNHGSGILNIDL